MCNKKNKWDAFCRNSCSSNNVRWVRHLDPEATWGLSSLRCQKPYFLQRVKHCGGGGINSILTMIFCFQGVCTFSLQTWKHLEQVKPAFDGAFAFFKSEGAALLLDSWVGKYQHLTSVSLWPHPTVRQAVDQVHYGSFVFSFLFCCCWSFCLVFSVEIFKCCHMKG